MGWRVALGKLARLFVLLPTLVALGAAPAAPAAAERAVVYHVNLRDLSGCEYVPPIGTVCIEFWRGVLHATLTDRMWVTVSEQSGRASVRTDSGVTYSELTHAHWTVVQDSTDGFSTKQFGLRMTLAYTFESPSGPTECAIAWHMHLTERGTQYERAPTSWCL